MTQEEKVTELRVMLGESITAESPEADSMFTNEQLGKWITASSDNLNIAAVKGWQAKMANFAGLVNVTDGAASREFSDLMDHAEVMVKMYSKLALGPTVGRSRVGKIVRP